MESKAGFYRGSLALDYLNQLSESLGVVFADHESESFPKNRSTGFGCFL